MILLLVMLSQASFGSQATSILDTALSFLGLKESDLCYKKDWVSRDSFRLSRTDSGLSNPLMVPNMVDSARDKLMAAGPSLSKACVLGFELLDVRTKTPRLKTPETWEQALQQLSWRWNRAESHRKKAFSGLSPQQLDTLLYYSLTLWCDDDSQSTALKGQLLREFGLAADTGWCDDSFRLLEISQMINWQEMAQGAVEFAAGVDEITNFLREHRPQPGRYQAGPFLVLVGDTGSDFYSGTALDSFDLVIELGGDDTYQGRAGGSVGFLGHGLSCLIDLDGDDVYRPQKDVALGSGVLAYGALLDLAGNDVYMGLNHSCGTGLWGAGFLVDASGHDIYDSRGFFAQASGCFGLGFLYDGQGNDKFSAFSYAQAFSSVKGVALLNDAGGNDSYYAGGKYLHKPLLPENYRAFAQGFSIGYRPEASGGFSLLVDQSGNDVYRGEVFSQGSSYWYSIGALCDMAGDDSYSAVQYAQGAGIHLSVGFLADMSGSDSYFSRFGPSQGEGHDLSVGFLLDLSGNDDYQVSGGLGVGLTNSVGVFFDARGNDTYSYSEGIGLGHANRARGSGGIGLFIDAGGKDTYPKDSPAKNNSAWISGFWGLGWDRGN